MYTRDLLNTTFIIPVKIEHPDRYRNAQTILGFMNHHLKTNVFIYEISEDGQSKLDFLNSLHNLKIKHWVSEPDRPVPNDETPIFHRTRYLNLMLDEVVTPVVCNYDIDVLINPDFYERCQNLILNKESDVIYPFKFGQMGQIRVLEGFNYSKFKAEGFDLPLVKNEGPMNYYDSEYGHCIFFDTEVYKKFGAENENFISYGPEDKERGIRFSKMGFKVRWIEDSIVYHFEHFRGLDSGHTNPYFTHNWNVYNELEKMDGERLLQYYKSPDYTEKYKTIGKH